MRIGVIGLGTIATAVVEAIAGDGHTILVSERGANNAGHLAKNYPAVTVAPNQTVVDGSELL